MAYFFSEPSRTFSEYLLVPGYSSAECIPANVSLKTPVVKYRRGEEPALTMNVPMVSAVMQAVSGEQMGIALAKEGGIAFGQDPRAVEAITKAVKAKAKQPVIMKLSPNVTDIAEMARAAEAGGADVLSLINTLTGMKIDIERQTFALANKTGGMSGPAVHPIAVRMVYQTAQAVKIPIIGMGGIETAEDAIEMMLAGATAVSVGTANFYNPYATVEIVEGIEAYMDRKGIKEISEIIGAVR